MLSVVMLSLSAAFASDNATDVVAIDNEIVIDEPLAVDENSQAVSADENVVTKDNFNNYFDSTGSLLSNVTSDELVFSGDISNVGVDNIVLETDAPYLAPVPYRGKQNSSKYIPIIAEKVAEIANISNEEVAEITSKNAIQLFDLDR